MMEQLERFENVLERVKMKPQIRLLNIVCDQKARKRVVTLTRSQRDEPLQFTLIGGESIFQEEISKSTIFSITCHYGAPPRLAPAPRVSLSL